MDSLKLAWQIRYNAIKMTHKSGASHIGSILSVTDIIAVLYSKILRYDVKNPKCDDRDRIILSKGHAGVSVYVALALCGFFGKNELENYYQNGSRLSGHISHKGVPGVEFSTGSLGHGLGVGIGMALVAKQDNKNHRIFVILGDGECEEGSVWEAALFAAKNKLSNITVIIDNNKMQALGFCKDITYTGDMKTKWQAFGWETQQIDGHDHLQLENALLKKHLDKPMCIVADTVKGKGISFMENNILWHYRDPQNNEYIQAIKELEAEKNEKYFY